MFFFVHNKSLLIGRTFLFDHTFALFMASIGFAAEIQSFSSDECSGFSGLSDQVQVFGLERKGRAGRWPKKFLLHHVTNLERKD